MKILNNSQIRKIWYPIDRERKVVVFVSTFLDQKEFVETITELMSIIYLKTPMIYAVEHILTLEPTPINRTLCLISRI